MEEEYVVITLCDKTGEAEKLVGYNRFEFNIRGSRVSIYMKDPVMEGFTTIIVYKDDSIYAGGDHSEKLKQLGVLISENDKTTTIAFKTNNIEIDGFAWKRKCIKS